MTISLRDVNPFVRNLGATARQKHKTFVRPYDCRMLYLLGGSCDVSVNGRSLTMSPCDVTLLTPDDVYKVTCGEGANLAVASFDWTQSARARRAPLLYDAVSDFDESRVTERIFLSDAPEIRGLHVRNLYPEAARVRDLLAMGLSDDPLMDAARSARLKLILLAALARASSPEAGIRSLGERVYEYLRQNARANIHLSDLSKHFQYHESYLCRALAAYAALSPHQCLIRFRLESAYRLLTETDCALSEIARETGFSSDKHLSRSFSLYYGMTPSQVRRL